MLQNLVIAVGPPVMPWSCELPRASYRIGQPLRHSAALVSESLIWTRVDLHVPRQHEEVDAILTEQRQLPMFGLGFVLRTHWNMEKRDAMKRGQLPNVGGGQWQVSTAGGTKPLWARSGRELFYVGADGALVRVPVEASGATWNAGTPMKILEARL